jgi:rhodanese-related sulfurtransferase
VLRRLAFDVREGGFRIREPEKVLVGMIISALLAVLLTANPVAQGVSGKSPTVVFVCEHGAAKSVIAAAFFNKLAADRHLPNRRPFAARVRKRGCRPARSRDCGLITSRFQPASPQR